MMNQRLRNLLLTVVAIALLVAVYQYLIPQNSNERTGTISEVVTALSDKKVQSIVENNNEVVATLTDGSKIKTYKESSAKLSDYGITADKVPLTINNPDNGALWTTLFSVILPFLLIGALVYFMYRSAQGANMRAMSFGRTQARLFSGAKKITFNAVAGAQEAKLELQEVVEFLRYPEKFKRLGAEIPKGVLLVGPPGTGKTLMARAVAGEAGVPFFSISASEFVEMFVGVGASRVRDLFRKAKQSAPAILFIDELDAIGRQRGSGLGGSHDEREQTLNQILVEMDGFETDSRVVVLASTNRPDVLDPALLRPGRFDRRVVMDLPDRIEREAILKIHTQNKPVAKRINFEHLAAATPGFSGADLRNMVNEAAILAARANQREITLHDFNQAIEKVLLGPERRSRMLTPQEQEITAYHEAGHAIVGQILPHTDPIHKISIISRGLALGFTWSRPLEDRHLKSKRAFQDELAALLAGRSAEELVFGEITTGAANDLDKVTKTARDMVIRFGMSDKLGPITLGEREELIFLGREIAEHKTYSDRIASLIDEEVSKIVAEAHRRAQAILKKNRQLLDAVAKRLIKEETIEGDDFAKMVNRATTKVKIKPKLKPRSLTS